MNHRYYLVLIAVFGWTNTSFAGLTDETQTTPNVPGGAIAKSLDEQVGAGHGDSQTENSAVYLIKRDPARSIRRGRQIFQRKFITEQGIGPRVNTSSTGNIQTNRALGAGLMDSCAGCHGRPRGAAGFGGDVVTRPDSRDAPHLFGLGLQEMLAEEMTAELRAQRDEAVNLAEIGCNTVDNQRRRGRGRDQDRNQRRTSDRNSDRNSQSTLCSASGEVTRQLVTNGISFGSITVQPDGSVDSSNVAGVDPDLRIRPFFHEGGTISMREFIVGAFKAEMGLEAPDTILCAVTDPNNPQVMTSPSGFRFDPSTDVFERPPVCDAATDGDGDFVTNEIDTAIIDHMEFYLLNYFKPGIGRQTKRTERGRELMDQTGCTSCHTASMTIEKDRRIADVETVFDPSQGIFNRLFATAITQFKVEDDGHQFPLLLPEENSFVVDNLFTDFKRHDLGPAFHEREYDGSLQTEFLTEALWGVATTAPYGHDGRSINLQEVILRHGGEAARSSTAFASLNDDDQRKILEFLGTLILFPPDDTASNLNPGQQGANPQDPANHGSINLGELFQINPDERE